MKTVKRSELGRLRMTAGNERKYNKDIMRNVYKELKDRDYDLYQKAIVFAAGLIENINSGAYATNQDACIESEIVKFTMSHLTKTST